MNTSATLVAYFHLCHRKVWLHARHIRMEHTSETVAEGKWIGETTYQQRAKRWKELSLGASKIDHYDPRTNTVREVKKSPKLEHAHVAQVKYYLYLLEQRGIMDAKGIIEYPKQRKKMGGATDTALMLTDDDRRTIKAWEAEIERIVNLPQCPALVKKPYCKMCSFYDFCFV